MVCSLLPLPVPKHCLFPVCKAAAGVLPQLAKRIPRCLGFLAVSLAIDVLRDPIHPLTERGDEDEAHWTAD